MLGRADTWCHDHRADIEIVEGIVVEAIVDLFDELHVVHIVQVSFGEFSQVGLGLLLYLPQFFGCMVGGAQLVCLVFLLYFEFRSAFHIPLLSFRWLGFGSAGVRSFFLFFEELLGFVDLAFIFLNQIVSGLFTLFIFN
jgi:hypothetical protein